MQFRTVLDERGRISDMYKIFAICVLAVYTNATASADMLVIPDGAILLNIEKDSNYKKQIPPKNNVKSKDNSKGRTGGRRNKIGIKSSQDN
ncbi:hypothetical protein [Methylobacterium sp. SI9]|uniref:hypothetical protein n=1 Tax=Methylobacterium guangdongense TaxID=3138811 RepID=UPI00313AF403